MAGIPRKELERLRRLNPGVSDTELTEAYIIRQGSQGQVQGETEKATSFTQNLIQGAQAALPFTESRQQGLRSVLSFLEPQTPAETAGLAAGIAAIPLTGGMSMSVPAALGARVGLPAITAGLTGLATGEGFTKPAAVEGLGGLGGELVGAGGRLLKRMGEGIITRVPLLKEGLKQAQDLFSSIVQEVPSFKKILDKFNAKESLVWLQDPKVGKQLIKDTFEATDERIAKHFGDRKFKFPKVEFDPKADPTTKAKTGSIKLEDMTITEIQDEVKQYKALLAQFKNNEALQFNARQALASTEQAYKDILGAEDIKLLELYENAVNEFRKGLKIFDLLKESKAIVSSEAGTAVDNPQLAAFLIENIDRFGPGEFPKIWKMLGKGGPLGASDVVFEAFRGARAITPRIAGGPAGAVTFPAISRRVPAGTPLPGPLFGTPGSVGASVPTILGQRAGGVINNLLGSIGF